MNETAVVTEFERRLRRRRLVRCEPGQACGGAVREASPSRPAGGLAGGLVGLPLPDAVLETVKGASRRLRELTDVAIYLYPGDGRTLPEEGGGPWRLDDLQHRAFRDAEMELRALGFGAVGVSSEPSRSQGRVLVTNRISHEMLSDPEMLMAREPGLPTFAVGDGRWYRRLTLVLVGGRIAKVFSPVTPAHSASQVIAWIRTRATQPGARNDAC
jgi:peroxiredoxin